MNIESIKKRLLVKYPFFESVVANSNFIAEPAVGTARTDRKKIFIIILILLRLLQMINKHLFLHMKYVI